MVVYDFYICEQAFAKNTSFLSGIHTLRLSKLYILIMKYTSISLKWYTFLVYFLIWFIKFFFITPLFYGERDSQKKEKSILGVVPSKMKCWYTFGVLRQIWCKDTVPKSPKKNKLIVLIYR